MGKINCRTDSYVEGVKPKTYRSWTEEERYRILSWREQRISTKEIAERIRAKKGQVQNIIQQMRKVVQCKCYRCGEPLKRSEIAKAPNKLLILCKRCKEVTMTYKRGCRDKSLELGLCGYCGRHFVVPGRKACIQCLSATYRRRNRQGLCGKCGKGPLREPGASLCINCTDTMRTQARIIIMKKHLKSKVKT
jgi:hypothetical protein